MKQKIYISLCIVFSLFIASCARDVDCTVTRFHEHPLPQGESIRLEPLDPAKKGSIEFKEYASLIAKRLKTIGYNPVGMNEEADLVAEIDYNIDSGKTTISRRSGSFVRYHFYYGRYYDPYYYGRSDFFEPEFHSETVYDRSLAINIVSADSQKSPDREILFEGWVLSTGKERNLLEIMPYLITAMFTNFPGESGVSKIITIEKDQ